METCHNTGPGRTCPKIGGRVVNCLACPAWFGDDGDTAGRAADWPRQAMRDLFGQAGRGGVFVTDLATGQTVNVRRAAMAEAVNVLADCDGCPRRADRAASLAAAVENWAALAVWKRCKFRRMASTECDVCRAVLDAEAKTRRPGGCPATAETERAEALEAVQAAACCRDCDSRQARAAVLAEASEAGDGGQALGLSRAAVRGMASGDCADCLTARTERAALEIERAGLDRRHTKTRRRALAHGCGACSKRGKGLKACRGCSVLEAMRAGTVTRGQAADLTGRALAWAKTHGTRRGGPFVRGGDGVSC